MGGVVSWPPPLRAHSTLHTLPYTLVLSVSYNPSSFIYSSCFLSFSMQSIPFLRLSSFYFILFFRPSIPFFHISRFPFPLYSFPSCAASSFLFVSSFPPILPLLAYLFHFVRTFLLSLTIFPFPSLFSSLPQSPSSPSPSLPLPLLLLLHPPLISYTAQDG